jgi:dGTPase
MVNDVLQETARRVAEAGVSSPDQVRAAGRPLAGFSEMMAEEERQLKTFLYARMYRSGPVLAIQEQAKKVLASLFEAYLADPTLLPAWWQGELADRTARLRRIGDFIAGMTDRYAISRYRELVGPLDMPEGF